MVFVTWPKAAGHVLVSETSFYGSIKIMASATCANEDHEALCL